MNIAVIKIGGSIFYDDDLKINKDFLKKAIAWFEEQKDYEKIIFVVGAGRLGRFLLHQLNDDIRRDSPKHRIGIKVTRVNSMIFASLFDDSKNVGYFESISDISSSIQQGLRVGVIGGVVEGWSTDMVAANIASSLGCKIVYKISNIDYIYSVDPNQSENAKPFETLTWQEYIEIFHNQIGSKHKPGMNAPIDIECSLFCKEENIAFRVSGGDLSADFSEFLKLGTLVSGSN